jgi:hypothetical protein
MHDGSDECERSAWLGDRVNRTRGSHPLAFGSNRTNMAPDVSAVRGDYSTMRLRSSPTGLAERCPQLRRG